MKPPKIVTPAYTVIRTKRVLLGITLDQCIKALNSEYTRFVECERGMRAFRYPPERVAEFAKLLQLTDSEVEALVHFEPLTSSDVMRLHNEATGGDCVSKGRSARKKTGEVVPRIRLNR